jgi:hypothetical protein
MKNVLEPSRSVPVIAEVDLCVLGGSCTGVFSAVRAARLGAKVALVEQLNCFGGTATASLVNVWHSLHDTEGKRQVIAGLTSEVVERLKRRDAVKVHAPSNPATGFTFNSEELKLELDRLVLEARVRPFLHTMFVAPWLRDGRLEGAFVENKSGRGVILARAFVDATGDADLAVRAGCAWRPAEHGQPSTTCARFAGWESLDGHDWRRHVQEAAAEFGIPDGFAWGAPLPGTRSWMLAGTRVPKLDPSNGDDLTQAELEGRRQVRAIMEILRRAVPDNRVVLDALPSRIGLRESRHVGAAYRLTGEDVLHGKRFEDAIAVGSYRVDIHHVDKPGVTFRYLDGREEYARPGHATTVGRWRPETPANPTFYQVPYRSLLQPKYPNLFLAGRMLDADPEAFAAVRVMVNMNQTGEAAGAAAWLSLDSGKGAQDLDVARLRALLAEGGSALPQ